MRSILFILIAFSVNIAAANNCKSVYMSESIQKEIERKFLLQEGSQVFISQHFIKALGELSVVKMKVEQNGVLIRQGYLPKATISIVEFFLKHKLPFFPAEMRVRSKDNKSFVFTAKGEGDLIRDEFEVEIPKSLFNLLWGFSVNQRVVKKRLDFKVLDQILTIDLYQDRQLMVAEVEFTTLKEAESFSQIAKDVTSEPSYKNKNLSK